MRSSESRKYGVGIKWKLFMYVALFAAFVLLIVWIFQVLLLDSFYERIKLKELHKSAEEIADCIDDVETVRSVAAQIYFDSQIYPIVFRFTDDVAYNMKLLPNVYGNYYLKSGQTDFEQLYEKAVQSGGVYITRITSEYKIKQPAASDDRQSAEEFTEHQKEILYVETIQSDGTKYIIMLDMIYTPLESTVNTLNMQFIWIAAILLIGTIVLTGIMSWQISTPIVRMNEAAKKLAKGDYSADFSGDGYRETRELAETLNYASAELSKSDKLQRELVANISHDLRTPLTMITGYSEVMRDIPGENTPENVQVIIDETTRLTELVNDILDISKIQSGTLKYEKTVFGLTGTVRSTLERYRKLTEKDGCRIEFYADREIYVNADRVRILQVVYNLINNAINYSGEEKLVHVTQSVNGDRVRISVTDNGEGIAPENITRIWDRYYKVDRVHKRATVGTGLGLSIVKGILEAHGATYGVESALGVGSTFWFELTAVRHTDETEKS